MNELACRYILNALQTMLQRWAISDKAATTVLTKAVHKRGGPPPGGSEIFVRRKFVLTSPRMC